MTKLIAMIPARLGSKRVKKKNLRLIDGKPLISYVIETIKEANIFDEIYLNSESEIFREIADYYQINFYKRPEKYSSDQSTNDEFALDFINNVQGDILIQILPTSPLLSANEIKSFTQKIIEENYDSLISVEDKQIACVYNGEAINFNKLKVNPPSQLMAPVQSYATVLMGWKYNIFKENMSKYGCAYHGGEGKTGYYPLTGLSTIDIDREEDFLLAEKIINSLKDQSSEYQIEYYGDKKNKEYADSDVYSILQKDGVINVDMEGYNNEITNINEIISKLPKDSSWSKRVINTESNCMTLIGQLPGEGNRLHYHSDWNEWWYIVDGEWEWEIEGVKKIVKKGDIVFMEKNRRHKITAAGNKLAIRMAVSRDDVDHIYPEE